MPPQEENLHRRSNLYQFLEDPEQLDSARQWQYAIDAADVLYSPNVAVFRLVWVHNRVWTRITLN